MSDLNSINQQLQNLKEMKQYLIKVKRYSPESEVAYLILLGQLYNEWAILQWREMQEEYNSSSLDTN